MPILSAAGLYVHSPFCVHKCGYCDFNSWAENDSGVLRAQMQQWLLGIERQVQWWARHAELPVFSTVFFGGGTPSLLDDDILVQAAQILRAHFRFTPDVEWTYECNPETLNRQKLDVLREAGATRVSVGIQSFDDIYLERLERRARRADNLRVLELLAAEWRGPWSLDLMFGLPGQSLEHWLRELDTAMQFSPQHVSAYQLTLTTARSKNWQQASDDDLLFFFNLAEERLAEAGLSKYEVSNFAVPGQECRHNLGYWKLAPFLGLGPGAAGLLLPQMMPQNHAHAPYGVHQRNADRFETWLAGAGTDKGESGWLKTRSAKDHLFELLMMGLRLREGVNVARFGSLQPSIDLSFQTFQAQGWLEKAEPFWRMTGRGARLLDSILPIIFNNLEEILGADLDRASFDPTFKEVYGRI